MATIIRTPKVKQRVATPLPTDVVLMNATANLLFALTALASVALVLWWLAQLPVFRLTAIRVDGDLSHNSEATIRANAAPKLAGTFFTIDLNAVQRAFESVPWVRHAIVRRVWPNQLAVTLEEHQPAALWIPTGAVEKASDKLVNTHGEVFEANLGDVEDDDLPTLSGPEGSSRQMLTMLQRLDPMFGQLEWQIETLLLSGRGSWRAELDSGARIELGRGSDDELHKRSERFVATVATVANEYLRPVQYADLRHRDGYALRLKGVSTTLTAAEKKAPRN
ncbi:cell division protein FtsQ/DivIB [Piscinibacter sakaiensis]|uniref:cell division protein FtsQ/DivIB n=1 Tax=Piscinibacter sakaiensis TaxID=1547922 RepID=UPI003AAC6E1E